MRFDYHMLFLMIKCSFAGLDFIQKLCHTNQNCFSTISGLPREWHFSISRLFAARAAPTASIPTEQSKKEDCLSILISFSLVTPRNFLNPYPTLSSLIIFTHMEPIRKQWMLWCGPLEEEVGWVRTGNVTQCNWRCNTEVIDGVAGTQYMREHKDSEPLTLPGLATQRLGVCSNACCL